MTHRAHGSCPPWSGPLEACRLLVRGTTVRTAIPVALVVGTVLSAINQGERIVGGESGLGLWLRVGANYVVPFLVSSWGFLAAGRVRRHGESG